MRQIIKRVTTRYSAGGCLAITALIYLTACQPNTGVKPADRTQTDSTHVRLTDDPPKKPGGPGCCQ